jgi:heat shock protein HslJ
VRRPRVHRSLLACLALLVAGCGPDPIVDGVDLAGTRWRALEVAGLPPVVGHEPTLEFPSAEGPVSGWAGCNDVSWTYRSFPGGLISVAGLSQSDRACEAAGPVVRQVEGRLIAALKAANRIDVVDGRLQISTAAGSLVFERIGPSG